MKAHTARSIAALGDVADINCWSGIPFHFWKAARSAGFAEIPWRLNLRKMKGPRLHWNLGRAMRGLRPGGFQYSQAFREKANAQIPNDYFGTDVITFHQHFPSGGDVKAGGGTLSHYLDATFFSMTSSRGLDLQLPADVIQDGRERERANYAASVRVITMARWTADSLREDCGIDPTKITTILPGANIEIEDENVLTSEPLGGNPGRDRDFVLGFIGMDWKRKGLEFTVDVRDELERRGHKVTVLAAGAAPSHLRSRRGVRFVGAINKHAEAAKFVRFLTSCDLGCLFSQNEALGISTLEFLRAGVPVAGFAHQGLADTLPPDAGFRFQRGAQSTEVADALEDYLGDDSRQAILRSKAKAWSPLLTWKRCVAEMSELWDTGTLKNPVRPWLGLDAQVGVNPAQGIDTCV
jgi:glycosyltransferase involved in cell wall biosynthesis